MSWNYETNYSSSASSMAQKELSLSSLRHTATWIREDLDTLVAREGPDALGVNDVLALHSVFVALQSRPISIDKMRFSRIHLAVQEICGRATRWPARLVEGAERVVETLESRMGSLRSVRTPLYEQGGRLYGICQPNDITHDALIRRFGEQDPSNVDNKRAYYHGSSNFRPGKWWINGIFALRDGVIDSKSAEGGITYNKNGAYAIVLTGHDETKSTHPGKFTYRTRANNPGRYHLTSGDFRSRYLIRVFRSHTLESSWAPKAGIRYEGLYKIKGWTIKDDPDPINKTVHYDIHFAAEKDSSSGDTKVNWDHVLSHPTAEDTDDYKMYKTIQREYRQRERRGANFEPPALSSVDIEGEAESSLFVHGHSRLPEYAHVTTLDGNYGRPGVSFREAYSSSSPSPGTDPTSAGDGSSDRAFLQRYASKNRRDGYDDFVTPTLAYLTRTSSLIDHHGPSAGLTSIVYPVRTSSRFNDHTPSAGLTPIEPFASLRPIQRQRVFDGSYESMSNSASSPTQPPYSPRPQPQLVTLDTRFRPVNWDAAPRLELNSSFDYPEETLDLIAPFHDFKRGSIDVDVAPEESASSSLTLAHRPKPTRQSSGGTALHRDAWSTSRGYARNMAPMTFMDGESGDNRIPRVVAGSNGGGGSPMLNRSGGRKRRDAIWQ